MGRTHNLLLHTAQKCFVLSSLHSGIRCDGREMLEYRFINVEIHPVKRGHAKVSIGSTKVLCIVTGEIVKPLADRPYDGFINFYVNMSPMANEDNDSYPSISSSTFTKSSEIAFTIESLLRRSRALDTEGLYVEAGLKVWSLTIDIHVLDDDGNVTDAAALAALASLSHFRRDTDIEYQGGPVRNEGTPPTPLSIHHLPVVITLSFLNQSENPFLVDPTRQEEILLNGQMTIAINQFQELCGLRKLGGQPVDHETIRYAIRVASNQAKILINLLLEALKLDEENRAKRRKNIWNIYNSPNFEMVNPTPDSKHQALYDTIEAQPNLSVKIVPSTMNPILTMGKPQSDFFPSTMSKSTLQDISALCFQATPGADEKYKDLCTGKEESTPTGMRITEENKYDSGKDIPVCDSGTVHESHEPELNSDYQASMIATTMNALEDQYSTEDFSAAIVHSRYKACTKKLKTTSQRR